METIKLKALEHFDHSFGLPQYESLGAAGADIRACLNDGILEIPPGKRVLVPTGLSFEIPTGFEVQVRPRSGLSLKTQLLVVNAPGTIDCDYRGEVKIILGNFGTDVEVIRHGDRIAQLIFSPIIQAKYEFVSELSSTQRGEAGFGSTGIGQIRT